MGGCVTPPDDVTAVTPLWRYLQCDPLQCDACGAPVVAPAGSRPSALMEDEDCPDLVPIGADGAEQTDASPGRKIPVTIITGYLGEARE